MTKQFYVHAVDLKSGEGTVTEPVWSEAAAHEYARKWAKTFYGDDDVTWSEHLGGGRYNVGRILLDGTRSESLVRITLEEEDLQAKDLPKST